MESGKVRHKTLNSKLQTLNSTMKKAKTAVLISGSGTNLQALIDAAKNPDYPAEISFVISNKPDAYGLTRAQNAGIETLIISHKAYNTREAFDEAMHNALIARNIQYICLAGFMRLLTPGFVNQWQGRMLNIHPSLLPAFKGAHAIADALAAGAKTTGCTVHHVIPEMDAGPIILQAQVPVIEGDSEESLASRIHAEEHRIYPLALRKIIDG